MADQFGYHSQTILSILNVQTTLMLSTKFQLMFLWEMLNISYVDPDREQEVLTPAPTPSHPEKFKKAIWFLGNTGPDPQ